MAMYTIGILPLIHQLQTKGTRQVWFNNATAEGQLYQLLEWWTKLCDQGPFSGYFANPGKTWLIVKEAHLPITMELFVVMRVNITTDGRQHLGSALGPRPFVHSYVSGDQSE